VGELSIILISFGAFEKDVTGRISEDITSVFQYPVQLRECNPDLSNYYNPRRRQYDANKILQVVSDMSPSPVVKTIGLLRIDLFIPILTYIFGQAKLNGNTGIVSLYRLRNELYGLEQNNDLLNDRLRKVVIHELGHTFGLIHCHNPSCIMRSSTYVEDIDQKKINFCNSCQTGINKLTAIHI